MFGWDFGNMTGWDLSVVIFYLAFVVSIGFVFRAFSSNISDYFRGGGSVQWWMVGASIFMVQFSAWTFTGAAGKAHSAGIFILAIFAGNGVGFFINFLGLGPRMRQLRIITNLDAVRDRFGRATEQFYFVVSFFTDFLAPSFWLFALSLFVSSVFDMRLDAVLVATGIIVTFMSVAGGSWAVIASDFIQSLLLTLITITTTVLVLQHPAVGGFSGFFEKTPERLFSLVGELNSPITWTFIAVLFFKQVITTNTLQTAYRYAAARDSNHARWAALLATILVSTGPVFWFLPPMAAHILAPDLGTMFPKLNNPEEAAFVASAMEVLPTGMLGLLVASIFAATMSCMDTGLNTKSGQVVKNFYLPNFRPEASDRELLFVSKAFTTFFGAAIILIALVLQTLREWTLFDLYILVTGIAALPILVPQFWGIIIKKTPMWAATVSTVSGFAFAAITHILFKWNEDSIASSFDIVGSSEDIQNLYFVAMNGGILVFCSLVFLATMPFYERATTEQQRADLDALFLRMRTPVIYEDELGDADSQDAIQFKILGWLSVVFASFILFLLVIPNDFTGRMTFLACGGTMLAIGLALLWGHKKVVKRDDAIALKKRATADRAPAAEKPPTQTSA